MKVWTALSLVALAFADVAVGQEKVAINTITRIEVKGGTIEIVGTQKPNFTSFTMSDPPRLVIDITEAVLGKGIEEEKQVGNGTVTAVKTASYGSDVSSIARVLVGFGKEPQTEIQTVDTTLRIRVVGEQAGKSVPAAKSELETVTSNGVEAEIPPPPKSEESAADKVAQAKVVLEDEKKTEKKTQVEMNNRNAVVKAQEQAGAKAQEQVEQARQSEIAQQKQQDAAREKAAAKVQAEQIRRQTEKETRSAQAEQKKQKAVDRKQAAAKERAQLIESKSVAKEERQKLRLAEKEKASAERDQLKQRRLKAEEKVPRASEKKTPRTLSFIGFEQKVSGARIFVQTDGPVRFHIEEPGGKKMILALENTHFKSRSVGLPMDTSYFKSEISQIVPTRGPDKSVRLEITLKQEMAFQTHQEGNELSVDFPTH